MRFPNTVSELITELDRRFGEVVPTPGDTNDKIMHAAGQRSVVVFLKQWRESAGNEPPLPRQRGKGRDVSG